MRIAILTNEYPPHVYGGAGVHVEYLTRELTRLDNGEHSVTVLAFGEQSLRAGNLTVRGVRPDFTLPFQDPRHEKFMDTLARDLLMAGSLRDVDVIHCHTWYTHLAGCLARQLTGAPLVLTTHSLEPHRPWKVEQLGTAYQASSWIERTAYQNADGVIAVSEAMREDVQMLYGVPPERIRVIHNGIDLDQYKPTPDRAVLARHGIDADKPFVLFVGRITRQKGIIHLVHAIPHLQAGTQVVLCAGAPDTKEIGREMSEAVEQARRRTANRNHLDRAHAAQGRDHCAVFAGCSVRLSFGLRAVRHHQPGGDGVRHAGRRLGGRRHQGSSDSGRDGFAGAAGAARRRLISSRAIQNALPSISPPPSIVFSPTRNAAGRWDSVRASASSIRSAGRASRGGPAISTKN